MEQWILGVDPLLIYVAVALLTFGESAAMLGLVLPGEVTLVAAVALAPTVGVEPLIVLATAVGGAFLGGLAGYELGRRMGPGWLERPWVQRRLGASLTRVHKRLRQRGGGTVAVARFNQVTRALVPYLAGMAPMPLRRYIAASLVGSVLWAGVFTTVGMVAADWWASTSGSIHLASGAALVCAAGGWWWFNRSARA